MKKATSKKRSDVVVPMERTHFQFMLYVEQNLLPRLRASLPWSLKQSEEALWLSESREAAEKITRESSQKSKKDSNGK